MAADAEARARAVQAAQRPAPIDREEFQLKVMGKTPAEVIEAVGKPDSIQDGRDPTWIYDLRTIDPVSRKVDVNARLIIKSGVVALVNFT